jgi:hypothetical protein
LVVYLFGGGPRAKNSMVVRWHTKHKGHDEFILVQTSGE